MFFKNKKGVSNVVSFVLYIAVGLGVIGTIFFLSLGAVDETQEKHNFDQMLKTIEFIASSIDEVSKSRFSSREVSIVNPGELEIDCENNLIIGSIVFNQELREDTDIFIRDVEIKKIEGRVVFKRLINFNPNLSISCEPVVFNKGKTNYIFRYDYFNIEENKIYLFISQTPEL